jgi:hypothetical protein
MEEELDIFFNSGEYHVNKRFHRRVQGPLSYLIKVVGVDFDSKKVCDQKATVCKDQGIMRPNEKYSSVIVMFFLLKTLRRRVRNEIKKKRYEKPEQTV